VAGSDLYDVYYVVQMLH